MCTCACTVNKIILISSHCLTCKYMHVHITINGIKSLTVKCLFSSHISIYWIVKLVSILSFKTNQTLYYLHHWPIKWFLWYIIYFLSAKGQFIWYCWEIFGTEGATLTSPCTFSHLNLERLQVCIYKDIIMQFLKNVWHNSIWVLVSNEYQGLVQDLIWVLRED